MLIAILAIILINFTKFHIKLVLKNNTTLEHLDSKRAKTLIVTEYSLGRYNNWISVFGKNRLLWFIPISLTPMVSDGIIWMKGDKEFNAQTLTTESKN